jgi:heterotetrameric sarcosine oxidase delta subunit
MLLLNCPFCGTRNEAEFLHGGPARDPRPDDPDQMSNAEWIDYLTVPDNPVGPVKEKWWHVRGCGQWFVVERNTLTHDISREVTGGDVQ